VEEEPPAPPMLWPDEEENVLPRAVRGVGGGGGVWTLVSSHVMEW